MSLEPKREPYDVRARLMKAGDFHSSGFSASSSDTFLDLGNVAGGSRISEAAIIGSKIESSKGEGSAAGVG